MRSCRRSACSTSINAIAGPENDLETPGSSCRALWSSCRGSLPEQNLARFLGHSRLRVERVAARIGLDRRRTVADCLEPTLQVRNVAKVVPLRVVRYVPRIVRLVGDRLFAGDDDAAHEPLVEYAVETI